MFISVLAMGVITVAVTSAPGLQAAESTVTQCAGVDNQGGRTVHCTIEVDITGPTTATVTVTTCTGAGTAETCIGPTVSTQAVTAIDQCNGSGNGGGAIVKCDVIVTGAPSGTDAVTVSQCVGSGEGGGTQPTTVCIPSSTPDDTSATIQQCDSSGNGGGGAERVKCTVTPANIMATLPTIKQCNGSGNGGGALVTCTVTVRGADNNTATPTGTETRAAGSVTVTPRAGSTTATPPATGILAPNTGGGSGTDRMRSPLLVWALAGLALAFTAVGGATAITRRPR